jgi:hypothetical protein
MKSLKVLVFCVVLSILSAPVFAGDLQYYFRYKGTVTTLLQQYQTLQKECSVKQTDKCADVEVHARNFLIQKATAYKEFSEGIVGNFESVFPNRIAREAKDEIASNTAAILEARYFAGYAQLESLPELEKTLNGLLAKNIDYFNALSFAFHAHKTTATHASLLDTFAILEKEVKLAESAGLDVRVAKSHLKTAEKNLDTALNLIEERKKNDKVANADFVTVEMLQLNSKIYLHLITANEEMLKASKILARFAQRAYW